MTARRAAQTHPTSKSWGAKKRLIAAHPSSEMLVNPGESKTYQFLIAALRPVGSVEMLGLGDAEERFFDSASRPRPFLVATVPNSKFELSPSKPALSQFLVATKTAFPENPSLAQRKPRSAECSPPITDHQSPITALTTPSPQLPSLRAAPLCYSPPVTCVPPIGHRAPAPAHPMLGEGLPPARTQEVVLCAS